MDSSIVKFRHQLYIPTIKKLALHLLHVQIICMHHCGSTYQEVFKSRTAYPDVLCHRDYAEHAVARFAHQIQSKYYNGNRLVSI